ncbi:lytic polysaccharide monooxygenase [Streptomyces sp. NPDC005820]|uniref:lytic polysaccharide monooxygenase auxiliary activity family 9 protein n=1 Tax=Streptomyces sp. NPDC005820 TaxID=3157069 RepID=UPI0033C06030
MSRMTAHRIAALTAAAVSPLLLNLWAAGPALAHGAPTEPSSRVYGCSPEGTQTGSSACKAAIAANGTSFAAWDNLRVANVNGRDRQTIPDGKLCSGGLPAYKGLDLARADWPTTRLTPGGTLKMTYASTIPHTGTFRLYLTKQGYDPTEPLTWSDLPERPFAEIKDPTLSNGAYRFSAKLPADRTGRQVLYTIWQNSSTPDTYYSCSDVVFSTASGTSDTGASDTGASGTDKKKQEEKASAAASAEPSVTASTAAVSPSVPATTASPAPAGADAPGSTPVASATGAGSGPSAPLLAGGAIAVLVLTGGAALALRLRRR